MMLRERLLTEIFRCGSAPMVRRAATSSASSHGTLTARVSELRSLRIVMQRIVEALVRDESPSDDDIAELNSALAACPARRTVVREGSGFRVDYTPAGRDWNWVRSEIAASFAEMLSSRDPRRIKMCENDNCRWVFCDESKSRSRRWCEDTCGNLLKVRRFRARKRSGPQKTKS